MIANKRAAAANIGIDLDPSVVGGFGGYDSRYKFICGRAEIFLKERIWFGDELVYSDPPYVPSTRRSSRVYRHDYSEEDHDSLLELLRNLPCHVMISGYRCEKYDNALANWKRVDFGYATRMGKRTESLWLNFEPSLRHDLRFVGWDFRGRQSFKRKKERWRNKFLSLPMDQRQAIVEDLNDAFSSCVENENTF